MTSTFTQKIEATKAARNAEVDRRVSEMMSKLDYSKHDKRNNRKFVQAILHSHYNSCLDSIVTPEQFDAMFAIYSPYTGTY